MVQKLYDEDGELVEIPDKEELENLQVEAKKVVEIQGDIKKIADELGVSGAELKTDELLGKIKGMKEEANPNFAAMRKKLADKVDELTKAQELLKQHNVEFGGQENVDTDKIIRDVQIMAQKTAIGTLIENELSKRLSSYDDKSRQVVRKFYDKLVNGEDVNLENVGSFLDQAVKASGVEIQKGGQHYPDGQPPQFNQSAEGFADTEQGKELGKQLFGDNFGKPAEERKENK